VAAGEGVSPAVPARAARPRPAVDFASGVPDLASFPRSDWVWGLREACRAEHGVGPAAAMGGRRR